jgi:hypothetical protein
MKIQILVSTALVNQDTGRSAGLYETVDAPKERAEYLISIGAARESTDAPEKAEEAPKAPGDPKGEDKAPAPVRRPATPARKPTSK